jgi:hypothetical protein
MVTSSPPFTKVIFSYIAKVSVELGERAFTAFLTALDVSIGSPQVSPPPVVGAAFLLPYGKRCRFASKQWMWCKEVDFHILNK